MRTAQLLVAALGTTLCLPAQFPDFTPPTPLIGAAMRNDTGEVKRLLEAGANPNEGRFVGGGTALFFSLMHHNRAAVEAMIEKGADVKAVDAIGSTTLMWAAYDETGDPTLVNLLLKRGVDPNAKNKNGETALAWALRRGNTPVVDALKKAGASDTEMVRQSVEKAIALLQKSGPQFVKVSGCTSCHNQSLPQMTYSIARERGFAVDPQISQQQVKAVMAMFKPVTADMAAGKQNIPDPAISVSYSLVGLAAEGYAPDATTEAMAHLVSLLQLPDGSFLAFPARPPIESNAVAATALSVRSIQVYGKDSDAVAQRARAWLEKVKPSTTEEAAMKLLGLTWTKSDALHLKEAAETLLALQRQDGGWGQLPGLESDAYGTGQALVALQQAGQLAVSDSAYQRGVGFLLRTQMDDGSWFVRTRSNPFQPYKESGFPHGRHQWISAAGTSWAAMALALTREPVEQITMKQRR